MFYAQLSSSLGRILLCSRGEHLSGLYFVDQEDCPSMAGLPLPVPHPHAGDPTAGMMSGAAIKNFKAHKPLESDLFGHDLVRSNSGTAGHVRPGEPVRTITDYIPDALAYLQADTPDSAKAIFEQTQEELSEYFDARRTVFTVPLETEGTGFQKKVWLALLDIPYGQYVSYGDVACAAGLTTQHGRAVGTAVGRNPISIIIPCHRVLSSTGTLTGYSGGLERKVALLELEGFSLA